MAEIVIKSKESGIDTRDEIGPHLESTMFGHATRSGDTIDVEWEFVGLSSRGNVYLLSVYIDDHNVQSTVHLHSKDDEEVIYQDEKFIVVMQER